MTSVVLPVEVPPATRTLRRCATAPLRTSACAAVMIACRNIVVEGEHRDRWFADGEGRCGDDRRDQPFEALAGLRQLGRHARRSRMHFRADMMGDETHDPFAVGG